MKSLFNFYLDDDVKILAIDKLSQMGLTMSKGSLSSLIRVLLSEFVTSEINEELAALVKEEYLYSAKKNKRSVL